MDRIGAMASYAFLPTGGKRFSPTRDLHTGLARQRKMSGAPEIYTIMNAAKEQLITHNYQCHRGETAVDATET